MASRASPPYNASHLNSALARLIQQYKDKSNIALLFQALAGEFQAVEDVFDDLRWLRAVGVVTGVGLDKMGYMVGAPRNGLSDAAYRVRIAAQVLLNVSSGSPEEIYAIISAMLSFASPTATIQLIESYPAAFIIRVANVAIPNAADVGAVLQKAKDAGVYTMLEYTTDTDPNSFVLEPAAAFLFGSTIVGATSMSVYQASSSFPLTGGSLLIDKGQPTQETLAYSAFDGSTFTTSAATQAHGSNATLQLVGSTGKGYGDTADGTAGGALAGAI